MKEIPGDNLPSNKITPPPTDLRYSAPEGNITPIQPSFQSSDIGTRTARPEDFFAEHRRRDTERRNKQKTIARRTLVFGSIALILIALIIIAIVLITKANSSPASDDGNITSEAEAERRQQITQDVYNAASTDGANAEEIFQAALDSAETPADVDAVRMGQLQYFSNNGDYEQVITTGEQINDDGNSVEDACESVNLDIWAKIRCHNMMALAYESIDSYRAGETHWDRIDELYAEVNRLELK